MLNKLKSLFILSNSKNKIASPAFFTVLAFILLLVFTWFYLSKPSFQIQEEEKIHSFLQTEFQNLLSGFIEKQHPEVKEISFHKVWTKKTAKPSEIKIFFSYSLTTEGETGGEALLAGSALLKKIQNQVWQIQNFRVKNKEIEFSDPLLIKASD
ncbi:MAG: hypothetical protein OXJ52_09650 [Oligoflexia bacterium]|nr:hypothetical protein [Oligoflexia bacterium]